MKRSHVTISWLWGPVLCEGHVSEILLPQPWHSSAMSGHKQQAALIRITPLLRLNVCMPPKCTTLKPSPQRDGGRRQGLQEVTGSLGNWVSALTAQAQSQLLHMRPRQEGSVCDLEEGPRRPGRPHPAQFPPLELQKQASAVFKPPSLRCSVITPERTETASSCLWEKEDFAQHPWNVHVL